MPQPPAYTQTTDFVDSNLDTEFANIAATLRQLLANIALIQRDDGEIRDQRVKLFALSNEVLALLAATGTVRGAWSQPASYSARDIVTNAGVTYICAVAHAASLTFAADLALGRWIPLAYSTAAAIPFTPTGSLVATTVAGALAELDADIYARTGDVAASIGFRNRIINGDCRIHQRATASVNTDGAYVIDRWLAYRQAGAFLSQQSTDVPSGQGFQNSILWSPGDVTATVYSGIEQRIEGLNVADLGFGTASAKSVVLSFWVKAGVAGTLSVALRNNAGNRSYCATYTVNSPNVWEFKTIVVPGDTGGTWTVDTSRGLGVWFSAGGTGQQGGNSWGGGQLTASGTTQLYSSSANLFITGVQLEAGAIATPFERRPFGLELSLCQRYYEKSYPLTQAPGAAAANQGRIGLAMSAATGGIIFRHVPFTVRKRTITPGVTIHSANSGTAGQVSQDNGADVAVVMSWNSDYGFEAQWTNGVGRWGGWFHYVASDEL
jgi:hypothetical protein